VSGNELYGFKSFGTKKRGVVRKRRRTRSTGEISEKEFCISKVSRMRCNCLSLFMTRPNTNRDAAIKIKGHPSPTVDLLFNQVEVWNESKERLSSGGVMDSHSILFDDPVGPTHVMVFKSTRDEKRSGRREVGWERVKETPKGGTREGGRKPLIAKFIIRFCITDLSCWATWSINSGAPKSNGRRSNEQEGRGRSNSGPQVIRAFHPMFGQLHSASMFQSSECRSC
jgi:hypothetical protein